MAERQPLSFWGTVGADMVASLFIGITSGILTLFVGGMIVRTAVKEQVREALTEPPPSTGGGGG